MKLLKERILQDGKCFEGGILKVDSFINHQMDPTLMKAIAVEFVRRFASERFNKVMTIEASGIAPAIMVGFLLDLPVIFAKKKKPKTMEHMLSARVFSFTKEREYDICLSRDFLTPGDRVLFIDDFLANGNAALGAIELIDQDVYKRQHLYSTRTAGKFSAVAGIRLFETGYPASGTTFGKAGSASRYGKLFVIALCLHTFPVQQQRVILFICIFARRDQNRKLIKQRPMKPLFIQYAKCGTCIKARKWLEAHNIAFDTRDIITQNPTEPELGSWLRDSSLPVQKFFNTSGLKYKELNLKDKVKTTPEDQLLALLASDGKLVKRPVLVLSDRVLVGFKEEEWAKTLL